MKRATIRGAMAVDSRSSKHLLRRHRILATGFAALLLATGAPRASAVILADNLDKPADGIESVTKTRWLASKFRVGGGGNFFLTEATFRMLQVVGGRPEVALYSDAGGQPGKMLGLLNLAGRLGGAAGDVLFLAPMAGEGFSMTSRELLSSMELPPGVSLGDFDGEFTASGTRPSGLALDGNTNYWLVIRATGGEYAQVYTDSEKGSGTGFSPEWALSTTGGRNWTVQDLSPLLYQVGAEQGIPVIEFRIDQEAIVSAIASGLPMALIQREIVFTAAENAARDVNARLFRLRTGTEAAGKSWEIFVAGNYGARDLEAMGMTTGFNADVFTSTAGLEFRPCRGFAAGGAITWLEADNSIGGNVGDVDLEGLSLSAYVSAKFRGFYADLLYAYGHFEHEIRRNTLFNRTAQADPDSRVHTLQLNVGGNFECGRFVTGPIASLTYITGDLDGYREKHGGTAVVQAPEQDFESLVTQIGWQVSREFQCTPRFRVTPQLRAAWSHEHRNGAENLAVGLVSSPFSVGDGRTFTPFGSFQVAGDTAAPGEDSLDVGAGLRVDCGERCSFFLDYAARLGRSDEVAQFVSLTGSLRF